jgi:hypothetical protein
LPAVFLLFASVGVFFPDGRFPGPRWRGPYVASALLLLVGLVLQSIAVPPNDSGVASSPFHIAGVPPVVSELGAALAIGGVVAGLLLAVASVIARFRRSAGVERQQVKWLVAAAVLIAILFPISYLAEFGPQGLLDIVGLLCGCLVPIAVGIAVLRYRLYDIDRIVSRTLSWTLVTAGVVALFFVLVVGLQGALADVTQGETVAVALSTIVAAALFQPVRRRVQGAVDRRFDRAAYDATQTVLDLTTQLRDEVDLTRLEGDVLGALDDALHPTRRSLWIRHGGTNGQPSASVTIPGRSLPTVTTT